MLSTLNGIFAFAIHDARQRGRPPDVERGALFIARDPLGVKPLYYAQTAGGFLFGSEIKALLRCRELSRDLDPVALHQMLAYLWTPAPRTMLAAVRKLEPGTALIVLGGSHSTGSGLTTGSPTTALPYARSEKDLARDLAQACRNRRAPPIGGGRAGRSFSFGRSRFERRGRDDAARGARRSASPVSRIGFGGDGDVKAIPPICRTRAAWQSIWRRSRRNRHRSQCHRRLRGNGRTAG